jgi:hypothetical protein
MPRYKLKKEHYLQDNKAAVEPQLHPQGTEIDWNGTPSLHMEPIDAEAKERTKARMADFGETKKNAMARRSSVQTGWSRTFEQNMERIITREPAGEDASAQAKAGNKAPKTSRKAA